MKKLFSTSLFAIAFMATTASFAQFMPKGAVIGGGSVGFSTTSSKDEIGSTTTKSTQTSFSLAPNAQYFVIDNLGVGAMLDLTVGSYKYDGGGKTTYSAFSIGPVARYYFSEGPFVQAFFGYGTSTTKFETSKSKYNQFKTGAGLGYSIRVNEYVLFDPMIGYQFISGKNPDSNATSKDGELYLRAGLTIILKK